MKSSTLLQMLHRSLSVITYTALFCSLFSQNRYPQTLEVPVTFYDFHSDGSNPEFEIDPLSDQVRKGMVGTTLDSEKKPVVGTTPFYNQMISRWFRPWTPGNNQIYNYYGEYPKDKNRFNRYQTRPLGLTSIDHDTSFKNIVIQDTLIFRYIPGSQGMYEFSSNNFFPLDNRGFGSEYNAHNYSFTMEMHWSFTMVPGLRFEFTGDDDVWAFVNNQLVMDLGGIHNPAYGSFSVDDIPGLTPNKQFSFDLFYAERHVTGSNIRITTNLIAPPSVLQLFKSPNPPGNGNNPISTLDSIEAGKSVSVYGHVFDTSGVWQKEYDDLIEWRIEGGSGVRLTTTKGSSTTITTEASQTMQVTLIATFKNPQDPSMPVSEVRINAVVYKKGPPVKPVDPPTPVEDHLDIIIDSVSAYAKEADIPVFAFTPDTKSKRIFAVVRDQNGNFMRFATKADWQSLNTSIIVISPAYGYTTSMSNENAPIGSQTRIVVKEPGLAPDTLLVVNQGEERTGVVPNPLRPGLVDITTVVPQSVSNNYRNALQAAGSNYVTLIIVESPEPLTVIKKSPQGPQFDSYASIQLYDAVGNMVRDDCTLIAGEKNLTYAITWDGTNRNGRRVGAGVYLMVIKGKRVSGQSYSVSHKIGVGSSSRL